MMKQYLAMKAEVPDALLLFRMGDFYEAFWGDAETLSRAVGVVLTARGKDHGEPIPMAGVPHHALDGYLRKLLDQGFHVAVAEQLEDPKKAKGLVKRGIDRVLTPALVRDPKNLDEKRPNWLASVARSDRGFGLALLDVSTGVFRLGEIETARDVLDELRRTAPAELLLSESEFAEGGLVGRWSGAGLRPTRVPAGAFRAKTADRLLRERLTVASLEVFGVARMTLALAAAGGILEYLRLQRNDALDHVDRLEAFDRSQHLLIGARACETLELFETRRHRARKNSLLHHLDRCSTAMGSRLLRARIAEPLLDRAQIDARLDAVALLVEESAQREGLRQALEGMYDIERLAGRLASGRASPRDLTALSRTLGGVPAINALMDRADFASNPCFVPLDAEAELCSVLSETLVDDPPVQATDGGLIRDGIHAELDRLRALSRNAKEELAALEAREREATGIPRLKIKYNRVFGYFIEVSRSLADRLPERYVRKQTLANHERFYTPELKDFEQQVLTAEERAHGLEHEVFLDLRARAQERAAALARLARRLAEIDVTASLAEVAVRGAYTRPTVDDSRRITIEEGRHPVVEATLPEGERFVPNSVHLDADERALMVLTGPNMAGKSTVLRQTGLIVVLAQMGSFVPARQARIGLVDRLFTRVGAADDLTRGQSTFMVEMTETAALLHAASERSLLLLDEIGRGTSTYDGVSIAWAVSEDVHDRVRCRAMFATHYHELTDLARTKERCFNMHLAVAEWGDKVVFLRSLREGGASRSYGIQVARLAGLPPQVLQRASEILTRLEHEDLKRGGKPRLVDEPSPQLSLFAPPDHRVLDMLRSVDPQRLTPLEALNLLVDLRRHAGVEDES
jgi:DNA mismatch repair protein MutS